MKTICIFHSIDLDGWMSAAIVKYWWVLNNEGVIYSTPYKGDHTVVAGKENENSLTMLGFTYGDEIPNLSKYDKIIMCDISFPPNEMALIWFNLHIRLVWIDHHISAINDNKNLVFEGIKDTKFSACELTWKYFFPNDGMPEIVRLLGRYDCFGHKGTDEERKVLAFQYGARNVITNYEQAYIYLQESIKKKDESWVNQPETTIHLSGVTIYDYLCTDAKQSYKNGFIIKLRERITGFPNSIEFINRKFICINKERFNPINFGIEYHKDGYDGAACFYYNGNAWSFSIYNDNGLVDCSIIAKSFGGGGHKGASGFIVPDINKFLESVKL